MNTNAAAAAVRQYPENRAHLTSAPHTIARDRLLAVVDIQ